MNSVTLSKLRVSSFIPLLQVKTYERPGRNHDGQLSRIILILVPSPFDFHLFFLLIVIVKELKVIMRLCEQK